MFNELTTDTDDRGQVGIGTLIIFIALVLVAAVAAGVLTNTAGELQQRADDTGDDAQAQVSNQIDVVSATGEDSGDSTTDIDTVTLVVKKSPGSDPVDLSGATIEYTSGASSATLGYNSGGTSATEFTTNTVDSGPTTVLSDNSERVKIVIDVQAIEGGTGSDGLGEGETATLKIVDQSGATTVYGVNVPDVLTGTYEEV